MNSAKILLFSTVLLVVLPSAFMVSTAVGQQKKQPSIYINPVRFTTPAKAPWNNVTAAPNLAGPLAKNLKDENGDPTGVNIYMETPSSYPFSKTPNDQQKVDGVFPDEVLWRGWGSRTPWAIRIAGLEPNYKYTLTFFTAQLSYEGDAVTYEINGTAVLYEGVVNNTKEVLKVSVPSDGKGNINIKIDKVDGGLSSIAALVIEDAKDNFFAPELYKGSEIKLAEAIAQPTRRTATRAASVKNTGSFYSSTLVNKEAAISKKRLVRPDHNPRNQVIEMYGGYEVDWQNPENKTYATANVHDPQSAWKLEDVGWEGGKLAGIAGSKPKYFYKQKFEYVKQQWKDLSTYYYLNRETRLDTIVFYQLDNRPINPDATCNFWYSLWGSKDNFTWTKILDSLEFDRSNRWKGYVTEDDNYYCHLRLKIESSDPNLYYGCKTNASLIKMLASGDYRGGYITTFMNPEDLPTAVEKGNTFNSFFGTNSFDSDPDTLRAKFDFLRAYMSYASFSNEIGGKFFINQNAFGQYNTHYQYIKHEGDDGHAVRWLKNNLIAKNKRIKELNPDAKILFCIQQGADWLINQKAYYGGWYYYRDIDQDKKVDYPQEFLPYSTTTYLLKDYATFQTGYTQNRDDIREKVTEYRVHPEGYEKAGEVIDYWSKDGTLAGWIQGYFDRSDPENPNTQIYHRGMRVPWDKHKAMADPARRDSTLSDPRTYAYDATFFYNLTAVHGPNEVDMKTLWVQPGQVKRTGNNVMDMLEWENETDQTWHGPLAHMWPQWAAAYMSAIMDGHMGQIKGPHNNSITGYMCAAPLLDFLYQGSTQDQCFDIKLALDALVAMRTKRKAELNAKGITKHPGNEMPLYILPPNFWANWHHYSGTGGVRLNEQYLRYPDLKDEKGLTATDDHLYQRVREETAWLKSFYPEVKTVITEWGTGTFSGGKFSPLKQDFGIEDGRMNEVQDSLVEHLENEKSRLKATAIPDKGAIAKVDRELAKARNMELYSMPEEGDMFYQQANWLIRGSLELWFSGLDKLAQYWLCDRDGYYDYFKYDESKKKLMPDHEQKWLMESQNNYATFKGFGLYGSPKAGYGGFPVKTSGYAFHNMKKILGDNVAVKRQWLNEKEKIKSYLTYNKEQDYYALVIFKATANNLKTDSFEIKLPQSASEVEVIDFVLDSYSPKVEKIGSGKLIRTITEKPVIVKFRVPNGDLKG